MVQFVFDLNNIPGSDLSVQQAHRGSPDSLIQQYKIKYRQNGVVAADTGEMIYIAAAGGTIVSVRAALITAPTTTDDVAVDVHKGSAGSAYATILNTPLLFDTGADRTPLTASLLTTTYAAADSFIVIITLPTANSTGTDLTVIVTLREQPS